MTHSTLFFLCTLLFTDTGKPSTILYRPEDIVGKYKINYQGAKEYNSVTGSATIKSVGNGMYSIYADFKFDFNKTYEDGEVVKHSYQGSFQTARCKITSDKSIYEVDGIINYRSEVKSKTFTITHNKFNFNESSFEVSEGSPGWVNGPLFRCEWQK